jgi:hypothetical protein
MSVFGPWRDEHRVSCLKTVRTCFELYLEAAIDNVADVTPTAPVGTISLEYSTSRSTRLSTR